MKLSVKSDYASRAVLALARHYQSGGSLKVEQIAEEQGVPSNYLIQILIELKAKQIVRSVRGKSGGYLLARPPKQITLGDVLRAIHGQVFEAPGAGDVNCPVELRLAWDQLQKSVNQTADAIDFQSLLEWGESKQRMYYI